MKKKVLKISGIILLLFIGLLIAAPFFLEGKISEIIKNKVNENIDGTLDFDDASLSLIKSFPNASVTLTNTSLVNKAPFEGDTLFAAGNVALSMSIKELFKGADEPIGIKSLTLDNTILHIKVDKEGNANYDIAVESDEEAKTVTSEEDESAGFALGLESYAITNTAIIYDDFATGMHLVISEMNHTGAGDLSLAKSKLDTQTDALVSFEMDSTKYLNKNKISLDALIGLDLEESKYSFLENKVLINQLQLVFDGFIQLNDNNQEMDISFKTPSSDFKNFLAVIPEAYASNLDGVKTSGNFEVDGKFKGIVDDTHIPTFKINLKSDNASFSYPDLPKSVKNININTAINNDTGITEDTYVNINKLSFQIDEDKFNLNAKIRELLGNTKVNLHADGIVNLANISKAYPMPEDYGLTGIFNANMTTAFDMASLEKHQYQNTKTNGTAKLSGFHYESNELNNPVDIEEAAVTFNPNTVSLDSFSGKSGATDFKANGTLDNLLGFVFNDENLEGKFNLQSNMLSLDDFMVEETTGEPSSNEEESSETVIERIKIPSFLDATINASANTVLYDGLDLKNVKGSLVIKDETASLQNLSSDIFGGKLTLNGDVNTKEAISTFDLDLGMSEFKIAESFKALDMFKMLAPLASSLQGKLNSTVKLSGNLKDDMTPNLATISGDLLAELLSTKVDAGNAPLLSALDSKLSFVDFDSLDLEDLKTALSFENGTVKVKPFTVNYKDVPINIDGGHTFDGKLQYKATLDVPAKYLGSEVNSLIAKIDDSSVENMTIPVIATIGGNYSSPSVSTDLTSGISNLTKQLVEVQKQKLLNKGKDKATDLLSGLLGGDKKDSTKTASSSTSSSVKETLGNLLGNKKTDSAKATDTTKTDTSVKKDDAVKDAATSILGGLFGKKKKKDSTAQKN